MASRNHSKPSTPASGPSSTRPLWKVLVAAAAGQYFLAQVDKPYTLVIGLLLYGMAIWLARPLFTAPALSPETPLGRRTEFFCFTGIMILALFLRTFRLDSMPSGMHSDQGLTGMAAYRIAFMGWRPFYEVFNYHVPEITLYYQLAGWFKLFGSSALTFSGFFVFLSLAAFPFIYWTFRQLSGPRVALLSLFLLAVMRWHIIFSRNGFPTMEVPFYLFGTLAFWIFWRREGKTWALILSAFFCGAGLYTYQSFKAVPLLFILYAAYERFFQKKARPLTGRSFLVFILMVELVSAPFLWYMVHEKSLGYREKQLFIGNEIMDKKTVLPALERWVETALMFNRAGDGNANHNIPGHRMLDDGTAVFFILGTAYAFYRRREEGPFYALVGLGIMSLPCLLSIESAHSNRMLAVTPFVAYLAARGLDLFRDLPRPHSRIERMFPVGLGLFLAFVTFQNAYAYFQVQAHNYLCWRDYGVEQTYIGKKIETLEKNEKGNWTYFLTMAYYGNPTITYLSYPALDRVIPFEPSSLYSNSIPSGRNTAFILEEGKIGTLDLLRTLFPGGKEDRLRDWDGHTLVYWYEVPQGALGSFHGWDRGIRGTYIPSLNWADPPAAIRWDPVLNFGSNVDFPSQMTPPFSVRWRGWLDIPVPGSYQFQALTNGGAAIWLDGRKIFDTKSGQAQKLSLRKGLHALQIEDQQGPDGKFQSFSFVWIHPGSENWEVVPAAVFGKNTAFHH